MITGSNESLISLDNKNKIRIWNNLSFTNSIQLKKNKSDSIKSISLLQNDNLLAVANKEKIEIWNLKNQSKIQDLIGHKGNVNALQLINFMNKTYLLSASQDNTIRLWSKQFENIQTIEDLSAAATIFAYNPNLQLVASNDINSLIKIWSLSFKEEAQKKSAHDTSIYTICVLNNGLIATGSYREIKIWKKEENKLQLITTLTEHSADVNTLIGLKNNSLVSGSSDRTIKIWNQINDSTFECINTLKQQNSEIYSLVEFESTLLISGDYNGWIYIRNQTTSQLLQQIKSHSKIVGSMIVLDNGNLATASFDRKIKIFKKINETSFELIKTLTGHSDKVNALVVLPNNMFASASSDNSIIIWNQTTFELIRILNDHTNYVYGLAVLKNGYFVSTSNDKTAIVWESNSFNKITTVRTNANDGLCSVSSYFDNSFITTGADITVKVFSTVLLKETKTLNATQDNAITNMVVLNNGFLSSAAFDGNLTIWDNSFNSSVKEKAHLESILSLKVFANGSLISCSSRGICKTWITDIYFLNNTIYREN